MVKIYTSPTCTWCAKTKEYLKSMNVNFEDVNVVEDTNAASEMIEKSGQRGVPVLDINGNIVVGFDKDAIDRYLTQA